MFFISFLTTVYLFNHSIINSISIENGQVVNNKSLYELNWWNSDMLTHMDPLNDGAYDGTGHENTEKESLNPQRWC